MPDTKRHIPQRTCVACRRVMPKRELNRLVRTPNGTIQLDSGGRLAGRGAYLCARCLKEGIKPKKLEYALKTTVTESDIMRLVESFTGMDK
ncbi:MAG: YlxR family protein [Dehalococcoidia bacterium]|nr:MAG: YlxR family protein [Dehalococcoidia bacterium]